MNKILLFFRLSGSGDFSLALEHPGPKGDHSVPSSIKAKNEWSYIYAPLHSFHFYLYFMLGIDNSSLEDC
jgi:hypothetical protein